MLQLIRLGKGHVHADLHRRLALAAAPLLHRQRPIFFHSAQSLLPLAVAQQHRLSCFQPQDLGVLGVFSLQRHRILPQLLRRYKKTNHSGFLRISNSFIVYQSPAKFARGDKKSTRISKSAIDFSRR